MNIYCTSDKIGGPSGGSQVTYYESQAFETLGQQRRGVSIGKSIKASLVWDRDELGKISVNSQEPWQWDEIAYVKLSRIIGCNELDPICTIPNLAHFYAGTFSKTIKRLKEQGCKVTVTCAAHDIDISRQEHEALGIPFAYPHLVDPQLWARYSEGYRLADVLIAPSTHSHDVLRKQGMTQRIEIIPHGVNIPDAPIMPPPKRFTVGYLGAIGADKSLRTLLAAWKKLNYKDALLIIAGRDSVSDMMYAMVQAFGGGAIQLAGWQKDVSDFYNQLSVYTQVSSTEGFGLEVTEAMAHGRPVICSTGAGACDIVPTEMRFKAGDVDALCDRINHVRSHDSEWQMHMPFFREQVREYTWDKIVNRYVDLWKELL